MREFLLLSVAIACIGWPMQAPAAGPATRPSLVHDLLQLPAPAKDWRVHLGWIREDQIDDEEAADAAANTLIATADDDEIVLDYWYNRVVHGSGFGFEIDPAQRQRLFRAVVEHPDQRIAYLVDLLPNTSNAHDHLKKVLDAHPRQPAAAAEPDDLDPASSPWQRHLERWLMLHSKYYRDELQISAVDLGTADKDEHRVAFEALARLDLPTARHLGGGLLKSVVPTVPAVVRATLYQAECRPGGDAVAAEKHRLAMIAMMADANTVSTARNTLAEALSAVPWPDRASQEAWARGLLLSLDPPDGLSRGMRENAPRWRAIVGPLIATAPPSARTNVIDVYIDLLGWQPDADTLRPLIPLLTDPQSILSRRYDVISRMAELDLPESATAMLKLVEAADGIDLSRANAMAADAAPALARYKPTGAKQALRSALKNQRPSEFKAIVAALVACDGVDDDEAVAAIEAYAMHEVGQERLRRSGQASTYEAWSDQVQMGASLASLGLSGWGRRPSATIGMRDSVASWLVELSAKRNNPELTSQIAAILSRWTSPVAVQFVVDRGFAKTATADDVALLLGRAGSLREPADRALRQSLKSGGRAAGIAAVVLKDRDACERLIASDDREAAAFVLATARLTRIAISTTSVAKRIAAIVPDTQDVIDGELSRAAEMYLVSVDTAESRRIVHDRHPNELLILGARDGRFDGENDLFAEDRFKAIRDELRREGGRVREIIALYSSGGFGDDGQREIRILADGSATLAKLAGFEPITQTPIRGERDLKPQEMDSLRAAITKYEPDTLPPLNQLVFDGVWYHFVHVTRKGGRQLYMNNPAEAAGTPYASLVRHFQRLDGAEDKAQ